jgi:Flp pilus assembly protein TadG
MFVGMVLLIGSVIAIVSLLLLFLSGALVSTGYGIKSTTTAQAAATAGAEDAMLKLERGAIATFPASYAISVNGTTATVDVGNDTPTTGFVTVTSSATFANHESIVQVVLVENTSSPMSVVSWKVLQ